MNFLKKKERTGMIIIKINKKLVKEKIAKEYTHKYRYT